VQRGHAEAHPGASKSQTPTQLARSPPCSQLGLTFCDSEGRLPLVDGHYCAWQFNFREFNEGEDMYAQDSIELLRHSGIDFKARRWLAAACAGG